MITKIIILLTILVAAILGVFYWPRSPVVAGEFDEFAKCLTEVGAIMYGADWCPHCQNEKRVFGKSFELVNYVECPQNPQKCMAAGIDGYPTWIFPDGKELKGEQGLEKLSQESGCELKKNNN